MVKPLHAQRIILITLTLTLTLIPSGETAGLAARVDVLEADLARAIAALAAATRRARNAEGKLERVIMGGLGDNFLHLPTAERRLALQQLRIGTSPMAAAAGPPDSSRRARAWATSPKSPSVTTTGEKKNKTNKEGSSSLMGMSGFQSSIARRFEAQQLYMMGGVHRDLVDLGYGGLLYSHEVPVGGVSPVRFGGGRSPWRERPGGEEEEEHKGEEKKEKEKEKGKGRK